MPTNVTAEYKKAEQAFRAAREPRERLSCLKEMLRTIPKHKGTEHLQADIKSRIKQLSDELAGPRKGGARSGPAHTVRPEGAAQVALLGPPNSGKSSLLARLSGAHTEIGPYPHTTHAPIPGMLPFEDIHFQLVDLPPVDAGHMEPWLVNALQPADAALLVIDISDPECIEQITTLRTRLAERKVVLDERWPGLAASQAAQAAPDPHGEEVDDPFRILLPSVLIANKCDLAGPGDLHALEELLSVHYPTLATSATSGDGLERIGPLLFTGLQIVRVYTKSPGKPPAHDRPFTLRRGDTVQDVARLVHKDIATHLRFARLWGGGQFDGQQVGPQHPVSDGDVLELHAQ